jgi:hypothetical protein
MGGLAARFARYYYFEKTAMSLRDRTLNQIAAALEETGYFKRGDFILTTNDASHQTDVSIEYRYNPKFSFHAGIGKEKATGFGIGTGAFPIGLRYSPGELNDTETGAVQNLDGLTAAVSQWTARIKGETSATPEMRAVEEQQRLIAELTSELSQVPDEYFSQDEAKEMRLRLEKFEQTLAKNLIENTQDKAELAAKIKALTSDVEMLRENISYLTKKNWASALCTRAFGWLKDPANQKLLKSGAEVVHNLLEGGHQNH